VVKLIKVENNKINHIRLLYILLSKRKYNISHKKLPSYREHKKFVINSPYRVWYLIKNVNRFIGSTYISKENIIGINAFDINNDDYVKIFKTLLNNHKPLKAIKSVRNSNFIINVNPSNKVLLECMNKIGMEQIQTSFLIKKNNLN